MTHITIERAKLEQALVALGKSIAITMADIDLRRKAITTIKQALAAQPAPEQYTALEQALTRLQKRYGELEAKVAAQPAPVHPDSARIDWLTNNPLDALDIFGHVKGSDAVRWIRQEIDNAMLKKDGATHD